MVKERKGGRRSGRRGNWPKRKGRKGKTDLRERLGAGIDTLSTKRSLLPLLEEVSSPRVVSRPAAASPGGL